MPTFSWEEIQKHNQRTDKWLVVDRKVYNVTKWSTRHPGGHRVIAHYAGEDATVRVWGLQLPFSATGGIGSPGLLGAKQTSGSESSSGRPGGKESESPVLIPRPESSSSGPPGPTWGGGRISHPEGVAPPWRSQRWVTVHSCRACCDPRVHSFRGLSLSRALSKGGAPRGFRAPSSEDGHPWTPRKGAGERAALCGTRARVLHSLAKLGGGEGKLIPGASSLQLGFWSEKVRNGCPGEAA